MTRPLSNDLRERVVAAVVGGASCRVVAARFGVAVSSVVKWSQRYRATGSVAPDKMGGHRSTIQPDECDNYFANAETLPSIHEPLSSAAVAQFQPQNQAAEIYRRQDVGGARFVAMLTD